MEQQIVSSQSTPGWLQSIFENQRLGTPNSMLYKDAFGASKLFLWVMALLATYVLTAGLTGLVGSPWTPDGNLVTYTFWSTNLIINLLQGAWIVLSFLTLLFLVRMYFTRHQYLCLYPQELVHCTRGKIQRFARERIHYLWRGWIVLGENDAISGLGIDALRLRMDDGREFSLDKTWDVHNWSERNATCDAIERDFVSRRLPALLEQFERGDTIDFPAGLKPYQYWHGSPLPAGSVRISNTFVSNGHQALAWDMVERFLVGEDLIQIWKHGKSADWYLPRTPNIANACLLRELVQRRHI